MNAVPSMSPEEYAATVPGSWHSRECAIFASGHDQAGRFRPVPCDCHPHPRKPR